MDKYSMRTWVSEMETCIDKKLWQFKKNSRIANGEVIQIIWQFEQVLFIIDVFWEDPKEMIHMTFNSPRACSYHIWHGLNKKTFDHLEDRIGNIAQYVLHPPLSPADNG